MCLNELKVVNKLYNLSTDLPCIFRASHSPLCMMISLRWTACVAALFPGSPVYKAVGMDEAMVATSGYL